MNSKKLFSKGFHPFHMVEGSPWPILSSFTLFSLLLWGFMGVSSSDWLMFFIFTSSISLIVSLWFRDIVREGWLEGKHTKGVQNGLMLGFLIFILSEVMFFFSFFFSFFFLALCPDIELGQVWPPVGVEVVSFSGVPFLNSVILLSSGVSITWAHHSITSNNLSQAKWGCVVTVLLGLVFTFFQLSEYFESPFTLADSVYGSIFYISTGFHGFHVLVGSIFILVSGVRVARLHMSKSHLVGFEMSAWYWHFVDVVWLFLFVSVYWWGS